MEEEEEEEEKKEEKEEEEEAERGYHRGRVQQCMSVGEYGCVQ
jgi:hypothetical protein